MSTSRKPEGFSIEEEFIKSSWPMPDAKVFENEFEKEAWLTVNVLRSNPKVLIPQLKEVKSKCTKISSLSLYHGSILCAVTHVF